MRNFCLGLAVLSALVLSTTAYAQDHHDEQNQGKRYYDSQHKDYHNWNADEDRNFHQYLQDNHKKDHDFSSAKRREQNAYWSWRHQHGDSH